MVRLGELEGMVGTLHRGMKSAGMVGRVGWKLGQSQDRRMKVQVKCQTRDSGDFLSVRMSSDVADKG